MFCLLFGSPFPAVVADNSDLALIADRLEALQGGGVSGGAFQKSVVGPSSQKQETQRQMAAQVVPEASIPQRLTSENVNTATLYDSTRVTGPAFSVTFFCM